MKIDWTENAEERLDEILKYYSKRSTRIAREILIDIKTAADLLLEFPEMGAIEPLLSELSIPFRSLVVRNIYKIIYCIDNEKGIINIITIWDCRQYIERLKQETLK